MTRPLRVLSPLHRAVRQLSIHLDEEVADLPVRGVEGHLLSFLASYAPAATGELGRVFGMKPSSLTSTLDRLEERDLLRREVDPDDRRSRIVSLTRAGEQVAGQVVRRVRAFERRVLRRVDEAQLAGFRAVLDAIAAETGVEVRPSKETPS